MCAIEGYPGLPGFGIIVDCFVVCCVVCACTLTKGGGFLPQSFRVTQYFLCPLRASRCCGPQWKQDVRDILEHTVVNALSVYVRVREAKEALFDVATMKVRRGHKSGLICRASHRTCWCTAFHIHKQYTITTASPKRQ